MTLIKLYRQKTNKEQEEGGETNLTRRILKTHRIKLLFSF